jgi:hypothetical protein
MKKKLSFGLLGAAVLAAPLSAQLFSQLNPSIDLTSIGVVPESGIIVEILGTSGVHVVSQFATVDLYNGFFNYGVPGFDAAINTPLGYTGDSLTPLPGVAGLLGIIGEQAGWGGFDFGGGIAGVAISATLFDFQGALNPGEEFLSANGLIFPVDLGTVIPASGAPYTVTGSAFGDFSDILFDITFNGTLNLAMIETNPDVYTYGGYTPLDFVTGITPNGGVAPTVVAVPEPSFIALISFGFIGTLLGTYRRR